MAPAHNRPLRPLEMLHVGTKLGIVYGIAMLVSLVLRQRTTCCQCLFIVARLLFLKHQRKGRKVQRRKKGWRERGRKEEEGEGGHTAHKYPRGNRRYKTIDPSPNGISELDPLNVVIEFEGNMKVS
jgi:hypothetical protein